MKCHAEKCAWNSTEGKRKKGPRPGVWKISSKMHLLYGIMGSVKVVFSVAAVLSLLKCCLVLRHSGWCRSLSEIVSFPPGLPGHLWLSALRAADHCDFL